MKKLVEKIRQKIKQLKPKRHEDIYYGLAKLRANNLRKYIEHPSEDSTLRKLFKEVKEEMKDFSPQEDLGISNEEYNDVVNKLIYEG